MTDLERSRIYAAMQCYWENISYKMLLTSYLPYGEKHAKQEADAVWKYLQEIIILGTKKFKEKYKEGEFYERYETVG